MKYQIFDQLPRYYTFLTVRCEYRADWLEWTDQLTISLFHWYTVKKSELLC